MRRASDLPRRRSWPRMSGRGIVITVAILLFVVIVFGRGFAQFYADALWHDALGRSDVFWGQISAKVTLFVIFFLVFLVLALANLFLADRMAPTEFPANVHPYVERFHELFGHRLRFIRYGTAAVLAFMLALPATAQWQEWLLFRNSVPFGVKDPQFGIDVGFYVFELPFLSFAIDWLFAALVIILLLTAAAHLLNGGVLFTSSTPAVRAATRVHLAALLALLAAVKAADYWVTRYDLTNESRGFVQGATYTVVNAQIPALMLLMLIALLTAVLYLWTIRSNRWRVPLVASALWLVVAIVGGVVYPAIVQTAIVRPNQEEREAEYIARNVDATRAAMNIDEVEQRDVTFSSLTAADVTGDLEPIQNSRLLNPRIMLNRFSTDRGEVAGLRIADLDVDRDTVDGTIEQTLVAARELDLRNIPNRSWQGQHLVFTRGCGLITAPANRVNERSRPIYSEPDLARPELYFSPSISGYAITGTEVTETECGDSKAYQGDAGVRVGGFVRRTAFALAFLDYNLLASGAINSDSQMLWRRSVNERVRTLAPFLEYDGDPYPVAVDGGVQWVIDAYTATSRYPYAQRIGNAQLTSSSALPSNANYIRNSVKAVVDAYTGDVTFYVMDTSDPILRAWSKAFPDLFTPLDRMPAGLRSHLRYPEDLFRVQTDLYSKYQVPADSFFQRRGAWSVAQAPPDVPRESASVATTGAAQVDPTLPNEFASESDAARFVPYYTTFRDPEGVDQFVMLRPFVRFSPDDIRTELQAYMTASSEADGSYGQLVSYVVQNEPLPSGPLRVANQAESDNDIGPIISLQNDPTSGKRVFFGDMQIVPVANGLVYVRPVYVSVNDVAEFRFVIVSQNDRSAMACDLTTALDDLFNGFSTNVGDRLADDGGLSLPGACQDESESGQATEPEPTDTDTGTDTATDDSGTATDLDNATAAELIAEANQLFAEAEAALENGDLGTFQQKFEAGADLTRRADTLLRNGDG